MVAGVVLDEAAEVGHDGTGPEHGFDPDDLGPRVAVADHVDASGIGGHRAADGGRVAAAEIDAVGPTGRHSRLVDLPDGDAGPGSELAGRRLDRVEPLQPPKAEQDLAAERHPTTDQTGVAALGDEGHCEVTAGLDDRRDLVRRAGPHDGWALAHEPTRPVRRVRGDHVRVDDDLGTDHLPEPVDGLGLRSHQDHSALREFRLWLGRRIRPLRPSGSSASAGRPVTDGRPVALDGDGHADPAWRAVGHPG